MATDQEVLDSFLKVWPIERLRSMTLDEYSSVGNVDSFTRWLESGTEQLGSIWGGSSFKFGVYKRKSTEKKFAAEMYGSDGKYAWMKRFGDTAEEAFQTVHSRLLAAVDAARKGDGSAIQAVDLLPAMKWKAAFLYQDQKRPAVVSIYSDEALRYLAFGDPNAHRTIGECYAALVAQKPVGHDIFDPPDDYLLCILKCPVGHFAVTGEV